MNIHEYQGKELLRLFGVKVTDGLAAFDVDSAREAAEKIGGKNWVVKAQIHAGGRGKAGGVKFAKSLEEVVTISKNLLGKTLVTHQTGPSGKICNKLYIQKPVDIMKEYYLGIVLDRSREVPVIMVSTEGGMEIEKVASEAPEKIIKVAIDPVTGIRAYHLRALANGLKLTKKQSKNFAKIVSSIFEAYQETDASLVEINPLVLLEDDDFIVLDAKLNFDDNSLFRHPEIFKLRDENEEEPTELEAANYGLNYVKLEGNVGCIVNGAGLAMSTMDIIKLEGGEPANFLDVGGSASAGTVSKGFEIILRDKNVKAILVNIFGGIVRCDRIANGILEAAKQINVSVPVIVRLDGTNASEASKIIKEADIGQIIMADDLQDAAVKAVKAVKGEN